MSGEPDDELSAEVAQLREALSRRTTIGVAVGILMERFDLDQGAALDHLRRISQEENRKVFDLAVELIDRRSDSRG